MTKLRNLTTKINKNLEIREIDFRAGDHLMFKKGTQRMKVICKYVRNNGALTRVGVFVPQLNNNYGYSMSFFLFDKQIEIYKTRSLGERRSRIYSSV